MQDFFYPQYHGLFHAGKNLAIHFFIGNMIEDVKFQLILGVCYFCRSKNMELIFVLLTIREYVIGWSMV